jgi:hypothetical protein
MGKRSGGSATRGGGAAGTESANATALGREATTGGETLTRAEISAVAEYQNESYRNINRYLRGQELTGFGNKEKLKQEIKENVKHIDSAFKKAPRLSKDVEVLRGVNPSNVASILNSGNPVGKTFTEKSYVSTTTRRGGYYLDRNVVMEIKVPKGTKVLQPRGGNRREREVLLDRGTKMKVTGVRTEKNQVTGETRTVLKMKVIK